MKKLIFTILLFTICLHLSAQEKTIKYLNLIEDRFGNAIGSVKVNHETISDMAIRETYLVKYEFTAIRCIFTYYKNDKGWLINAFKWDDSFSEEFKESPATLTK